MNFVLDASVTLAWCFEDEGDAYAVQVLDALRPSEAVVASLWPLEVANGLLVAERRGRLEAAGAARFMELVLGLSIAMDPGTRSPRAPRYPRRGACPHALGVRRGLSGAGPAARHPPRDAGWASQEGGH